MDISTFLEKHCKFRLRSGKEVYGVMWLADDILSEELYFASSREYKSYCVAREKGANNLFDNIAYRLNRDDIVAAEVLDQLGGNTA